MGGTEPYPKEETVTVLESSIHGEGVFAARDFALGHLIAYFEGFPVSHDTKYSLTLGLEKIEPTGKLRSLDHSCEPNAHFVGRTLVASRSIQAGEEITINYLETEVSLSYPFPCDCRTQGCAKKIRASKLVTGSST